MTCTPSQADAAAPKRRPGRPRVHADAAARQAAYKERHGLTSLTLDLPADVIEGLREYMVRHSRDGEGLTQSQVVAKLLRTQLLRKR